MMGPYLLYPSVKESEVWAKLYGIRLYNPRDSCLCHRPPSMFILLWGLTYTIHGTYLGLFEIPRKKGAFWIFWGPF